ncbi:MAG: hypothetical protein ACRD8U_21775 [Pyrinomonadaceae bacterium]
MNDDRIPKPVTGVFGRPRAFDTIVYGGLVVGILDGMFALIFYGLIMGAQPLRIFQSVAAGLLGRAAAFEGGIRTFLIGLLLHFVVASCIAAVYFIATLRLPVLIRYAVVSGLIYGMIAYLVMNQVVVPLSAIGRRPAMPRLPVFLTEIIGHALLVGLPLRSWRGDLRGRIELIETRLLREKRQRC